MEIINMQVQPVAGGGGMNPFITLRALGSSTIILCLLTLIFYIFGLGGVVGFDPQYALSKFQVWRFITFPIASSGFLNMLMNVLAAMICGLMLERDFGSVNYLIRVFTTALLLSLVIETPLYFLTRWIWPWFSTHLYAYGMTPILLVEIFIQAIIDSKKPFVLPGIPTSVPQIAVGAVFALLTFLSGDMSPICCALLAFIELNFLQNLGMVNFPASQIFSAEKSMMFLDKVGTFYTINDKNVLMAGHPAFGVNPGAANQAGAITKEVITATNNFGNQAANFGNQMAGATTTIIEETKATFNQPLMGQGGPSIQMGGGMGGMSGMGGMGGMGGGMGGMGSAPPTLVKDTFASAKYTYEPLN